MIRASEECAWKAGCIQCTQRTGHPSNQFNSRALNYGLQIRVVSNRAFAAAVSLAIVTHVETTCLHRQGKLRKNFVHSCNYFSCRHHIKAGTENCSSPRKNHSLKHQISKQGKLIMNPDLHAYCASIRRCQFEQPSNCLVAAHSILQIL